MTLAGRAPLHWEPHPPCPCKWLLAAPSWQLRLVTAILAQLWPRRPGKVRHSKPHTFCYYSHF